MKTMAALRPPARIDARTAGRLAALAAATFVYVTFEVFPVGLLPDIARGLDVPAGRVGLLVGGYAVVAAVVTVPTVALAARVSRGTALLVSLLVLIAAEVLAALAHSYPMMVASRVAAALTHGVLWSLIAPAAAALAPRERAGTATAAVFGGSSLAAIAGSPGTALIGRLIGWRATALLLALVTAVVAAALVWALRGQRGDDLADPAAPRQEAAAAGAGMDRRAVLTLCGVALVLVTAHFISYTYFSVLVSGVTGSSAAVVALLTVFGLAGAVGTFLVGRHNDTAPRRTATVTMAVFVVGVALLLSGFAPLPAAVAVTSAAVGVALWGGAFAAAGPVFQTGIMRVAAAEADRASSVYVTCFQVGIAGGSAAGAGLLGGAAVWLPVVSLGLAGVVLLAVRVLRPVPEAPGERAG
ncbi:putative MFS family arabinose efflux permease [Streptomyces puniciscabiei]|uniref:Putative MFS family arabinose efflux permease n=1 Tax=Streptomyces puniciscabiei TaxID=164348 RepID=A0A542SXK8_9ACTN|nr:MFS transporter [Streptomyces puniciscabiei]TQK79333.1 putative MFS family arabinose efflux permease [Streptomyces puniciscabiei]